MLINSCYRWTALRREHCPNTQSKVDRVMNAIPYLHGVVGLAARMVFAGIILAAGCIQRDSPVAEATRPVKTMVVTTGGSTHVRVFPGKVEASKKAVLAFQVSGLLAKLPLKEGQNVVKGEMIAQLRQDEFQARLKAAQSQLDQSRASLRALRQGERPEERLRLESQVRAAEAKLANASAEFDRASSLLSGRAISRTDYELSKTAYSVAQEELKSARKMLEIGTIAREEDIDAREAEVRGLESRVVEASIQLEDCTLLAPYDGVIAEQFVTQDQSIKAMEPVVKFQDVDEIVIAVEVPEIVMAADLRSADIVQMIAEFSAAPGLQFPVEIREISQRADPTTQTFTVRAAMKAPPNVNLLPGMTATIALTYRRASVLGDPILVPISAVSKDGSGEQAAWVIGPDQRVRRRPVKIGDATGGQIEITDGLHAGDRIAVAGATFLREGMQVRDLGDALGGG
jgi:RND family efflux transporter MFP subunit